MKTEKDGHLPFLDIDIYSRPDTAYNFQEGYSQNLYLNATSHHHHTDMHSVLSTLAHGAWAICSQESLHTQLDSLNWTFRQNCYSNQQIRHVFKQPHTVKPPEQNPSSVTVLPFYGTTCNGMSMMLSKHNIKTVGIPPRKISSSLWSITDHQALKRTGIYSIHSACGTVYIQQTGHSIETRVMEHHCHKWHYHQDKLVVAEHSISMGNGILPNDTYPYAWIGLSRKR